MKGTWVVALLIVASVTGAAIQTDGSDCPVEVGESDEPGQELANVVGAQQSVVAREIERRGFNATLANASTPEERATVVATELERIEHRLETLEACQGALIEAREDGDLTAEAYRQRAETLATEIADTSDRLDRAREAADDLSPEVRVDSNVEPERLESLSTRVEALQSFVDKPGRAVESVTGNAGESTPPEPAPTDPPLNEQETADPTEELGEQPTKTIPQNTEVTSPETPTPETTELETTEPEETTELPDSTPTESDEDRGENDGTPEPGRTGISGEGHYAGTR